MKSSNFTSRWATLCLVLYLAADPSDSHTQLPPSPLAAEELLPADGAAIDVMQLVVPPRLDELTKKLQQAGAKEPDWLLAQVQKAKPGEPLLYDTRLGLTKEEYDEYIGLSMKLTLKKEKAIKVSVKPDGKRVVLNFGGDLPNLKKIELDLKADTITTPFGVATNHSRISANEGQKTTAHGMVSSGS